MIILTDHARKLCLKKKQSSNNDFYFIDFGIHNYTNNKSIISIQIVLTVLFYGWLTN